MLAATTNKSIIIHGFLSSDIKSHEYKKEAIKNVAYGNMKRYTLGSDSYFIINATENQTKQTADKTALISQG